MFHYRIPVFDELSRMCDLTVAYTLGELPKERINFKVIKLNANIYFKRFYIHRENIFALSNKYDAVIIYGDISWLSYSILPWRKKKKFKVAFWTIGVSASYKKHYDTNKKWDRIRNLFYKQANALIFYSDYPLKKYIQAGFDKNSLFVANNTVQVRDINRNTVKQSILFQGTLYKEKGVLYLLQAYKMACNKKNKQLMNLEIVGAGEDFVFIKDWVIENQLDDKIILHGAIYDEEKKSKIFARSIALISPKQAGLAVLESMGYGVPFITEKNAITGGEIFNIQHGTNGILLDSIDQLYDIILDINDFPDKYITMGNNAYHYYQTNRTPKQMAENLFCAVKYMLTNK